MRISAGSDCNIEIRAICSISIREEYDSCHGLRKDEADESYLTKAGKNLRMKITSFRLVYRLDAQFPKQLP